MTATMILMRPSWVLLPLSRSSQTSDFQMGIPVPTLPGVWRYNVRAGTGWTKTMMLMIMMIMTIIIIMAIIIMAIIIII